MNTHLILDTPTLTEIIVHKLCEIVLEKYHYEASRLVSSELTVVWSEYANSRKILYSIDETTRIADRCLSVLIDAGIRMQPVTEDRIKAEIIKLLDLGLSLKA